MLFSNPCCYIPIGITIHITILLVTGWIDHLVSYESERQRHNVTSTAGIDSLYRLYSTQFTPLVLARSIGLATVNALNPIKVCKQLTGYTVNICHTSYSSNLEAKFVLKGLRVHDMPSNLLIMGCDCRGTTCTMWLTLL